MIAPRMKLSCWRSLISRTLSPHSQSLSSTSTSSNSLLSFERFGDQNAPHVAVFLHGVLGSKKNMRTPAKEFIKLYPNYSSIVIDLRGHGLTPPLTGPNTMKQCAIDLQNLFQIELKQEIPTLLCGHSLSGKVVLNYLSLLSQQHKSLPINSWILDSLPGPYDLTTTSSDSQSVAQILNILQTIPVPFPSRNSIIKTLTAEHHISPAIATWLGTSVIDSSHSSEKRTSDERGGSQWSFQLPVVLELFHDFCQEDLWETLEHTFPSEGPGLGGGGEGRGGMIHYVRAGRQKKWKSDILEHFEKIEKTSAGRVKLYTMPNVGHWLHAEDLPGLLRLMKEKNQIE
jgi:pimeloyl-ACP methyl ester carboxylesterase